MVADFKNDEGDQITVLKAVNTEDKHVASHKVDDACDKYAMVLHTQRNKKDLLQVAKGNPTFELYKSQTGAMFGFTPLGNIDIPEDKQSAHEFINPIQAHVKIKQSGLPNFKGLQIPVPSQFNIDKCAEKLKILVKEV